MRISLAVSGVDWSHDRLPLDEQRLHLLCGVSSGGFTLDLLAEHDSLRESIAWGQWQAEAAIRADAVTAAVAAAVAAIFTAWRREATQCLESCEALAEGRG